MRDADPLGARQHTCRGRYRRVLPSVSHKLFYALNGQGLKWRSQHFGQRRGFPSPSFGKFGFIGVASDLSIVAVGRSVAGHQFPLYWVESRHSDATG